MPISPTARSGPTRRRPGPATRTRITPDALHALVRTIPDFPKPGIAFRDITTLIADGPGFGETIRRLQDLATPLAPDSVVAIDARGFIFGSALAFALGVGVVPARKQGKLPGATMGIDYALEYGTDRLELPAGMLRAEQRVIIVDDLIATGGTALACAALVRQTGATLVGALFAIDLPDLGGSARLRDAGVEVASLMTFPGH